MDIRHFYSFVEVARQLNFTKAASILHVSQPSLSKTIKDMEETIGVELFYRDFRKLELTDAGRALLENVKPILDAYENVTSGISEIMNLEKGEIRIGIPPIISSSFCAELIGGYIDMYPSIDVSLLEVGTKKIVEGIREGTLDIGFACNNPKNEKDIETIHLIKDPLCVVAHKEHPFCDEIRLSFADLKEESFIMYQQDFSLYDKIISSCLSHDYYPAIVCESSQKDLIVQMVASSLGIALLPSKIASKIESDKIVSIPLSDPSVYLELCILWKKSNYLPFSVREFINLSETYYF